MLFADAFAQLPHKAVFKFVAQDMFLPSQGSTGQLFVGTIGEREDMEEVWATAEFPARVTFWRGGGTSVPQRALR